MGGEWTSWYPYRTSQDEKKVGRPSVLHMLVEAARLIVALKGFVTRADLVEATGVTEGTARNHWQALALELGLLPCKRIAKSERCPRGRLVLALARPAI